MKTFEEVLHTMTDSELIELAFEIRKDTYGDHSVVRQVMSQCMPEFRLTGVTALGCVLSWVLAKRMKSLITFIG